jgi:hypothetical protein
MLLPARLEITLTETHDKKPLVTVENLPGPGCDLTPRQLRALAAALYAAAYDCEDRLADLGDRFWNLKKHYPLNPQ